MRKLILIMLFVVLGGSHLKAQDYAVKSNLVSDSFRNLNLGLEFGLAPKWTLDLSGEYNGWKVKKDAARWKHWSVQPEARLWLCDRFAGHFFGLHAHGGQYNVGGLKNSLSFLGTDYSKLTDTRFQGWFAGAGISYGYAWILGEHWNLEAELGAGYSYTEYDRFNCMGCGRKIETQVPHHYLGLTKVAINLVYLF